MAEKRRRPNDAVVWGQILHFIILPKTYLFYFAFSYVHAGQETDIAAAAARRRPDDVVAIIHIFAPVVGDDGRYSAKKMKKLPK